MANRRKTKTACLGQLEDEIFLASVAMLGSLAVWCCPHILQFSHATVGFRSDKSVWARRYVTGPAVTLHVPTRSRAQAAASVIDMQCCSKRAFVKTCGRACPLPCRIDPYVDNAGVVRSVQFASSSQIKIHAISVRIAPLHCEVPAVHSSMPR